MRVIRFVNLQGLYLANSIEKKYVKKRKEKLC